MKVGDEVECLRWSGSDYTKGRLYKIEQVWDSGEFSIVNNHNRNQLIPSHFLDNSFRLIQTGMYEPMFDLDDMELAEILMEEMKNA